MDATPLICITHEDSFLATDISPFGALAARPLLPVCCASLAVCPTAGLNQLMRGDISLRAQLGLQGKGIMSRTFEVLERMQQDQELFRVPPVIKAPPLTDSAIGGKTSLPDLEGFTRGAVLRLVERLFLTTDANDRNSRRRVVFCGIDEGAGSKSLCAEIGRSLANQVQSQVCVMDANVRVPTHISLFDLLPCDSSPHPDDVASQRVLRRVAKNLCVVSPLMVASKDTPTIDQARALIRNLSDEFAYVVISAPPIGLYGDAALLGQMVDGVVLVLEANSTRRVTAKKAKQALQAANVRILGTVLNNRTFPIPERIYRLL